jgi:hypothetical protein
MRIFILAAMALIAQPALAQSSDASGAATSNTSNGSTSQNTDATAANTVVVNAVAGNPQYAPADSTVKYSGHTYSTPSMGGSVFGGTNPCMIGTGGAAAGGPIGFSLSIGKSDDGCMRRSEAAAWHALAKIKTRLMPSSPPQDLLVRGQADRGIERPKVKSPTRL